MFGPQGSGLWLRSAILQNLVPSFCHLATLHISGRGHLSGGLLRIHLPGDAGVLCGLLPGAGQPQDQRAPHERRVGRAAAVRGRPGKLFCAVVGFTFLRCEISLN